MDFTFDQSKRLNPLEVYQTGIQLMYEIVQREWDENVRLMVAEQIEGYNVLMMFINLQAITVPNQLMVSHCIAALYRAIAVMTDGVIFCQLRSHLSIFNERVGTFSIGPVADALDGIESGNMTTLIPKTNLSTTDISAPSLGFDSGTIRDPDNSRFSITYHFLGRNIIPREVSMVVLEAMTTAGPFTKNAECKGIDVVSVGGGAAIVIESTHSDRARFTYGWATRSLKILYQGIIVPRKRWGDVWLEMKYEDVKFGELRMLRITGGEREGMDAGKEER
ncbi:MAG: hypothetical protein LQ337_008356 [Flavoplaca oasis]|nr:MAG: hypothetical protein LQ337_008356 [Flavoplaca oasis]